jgi:hypothetical protein
MKSIIDIIAGWCVRENKSPIIASKMITMYNDDDEFWANQSLWNLFDAVNA